MRAHARPHGGAHVVGHALHRHAADDGPRAAGQRRDGKGVVDGRRRRGLRLGLPGRAAAAERGGGVGGRGHQRGHLRADWGRGFFIAPLGAQGGRGARASPRHPRQHPAGRPPRAPQPHAARFDDSPAHIQLLMRPVRTLGPGEVPRAACPPRGLRASGRGGADGGLWGQGVPESRRPRPRALGQPGRGPGAAELGCRACSAAGRAAGGGELATLAAARAEGRPTRAGG